jgi:hypothetical protein
MPGSSCLSASDLFQFLGRETVPSPRSEHDQMISVFVEFDLQRKEPVQAQSTCLFDKRCVLY